ncbi:MAG TPA: glycoside hydrolase family 15 protein, partial [Candidatus Dormibacteraeota bacterium]|nr:glycoside hydrolase family 15 protein [Candidatus Dormibacteraeota bacterium]
MTGLARLPRPGAPRPRPVEEYACLADGRSAALVHVDGACDWWSGTSLDGPPRLARLLDARRGGSVAVRPLAAVPVAAGWDGETTVMRVVWATVGAPAVEVRTALVDGPDGDPALVWWVTGPPGTPVAVELTAPTAGSVRAWSVSAERAWLAPGGMPDGPCGGLAVTLGGPAAEPQPDGLRLTIPPAGRLAVWLRAEPASAPAPSHPGAAVAALRRRIAADRAFVSRLTLPPGRRAAAVRSALTLRGLQDRGGGACLAAPTTSLPQWPGSARTWDYRFAWLRDNADAGLALLRVGAVAEAAAVGAALARQLGPDPGGAAPVHGLGGGPVPAERRARHLAGYGGARPVRVGNA